MQITITLQGNGMVTLSKIYDGYVLPVIWFENIEYFDEFINSCLIMSRCFKSHISGHKQLSPVIKGFINQLDLSGI